MALITTYLCTDKKKEAVKIFENMIVKIKGQIVHQKIVRCEPYWKVKDQYAVSAEMEFKNGFTSTDEFKNFLYSVSPHWEYIGKGNTDFLAARYIDGCEAMQKDIYFININLNC